MFDETISEAPAAQPGGGRELSAGRVLLAEDDTEMRRLLASALRKARYDVIEAADGKDMIDQICESLVAGCPFDFIVTDVRMPKLTGTQVMKFINDAGVGLPAIVITAFGDHTTRIEAYLLGAAAVLDKPFEIEDLMDEVRRLKIIPGRGLPTS